jgi:hypothetical protein
VYFAIHTIIYRFGLYASGGYSFFLLPIAPAFAIAAAIGLEFVVVMSERMRKQFICRIRISPNLLRLGTGILLAVTVAYGMREHPHVLTPEAAAIQQLSGWLKAKGLGSRPTVVTNVQFYYFHPLPVAGSYWWKVPKLAGLVEGTIVVWDRHYSNRWGLNLAELENSKSWRKLHSFGIDRFAIAFEKVKGASETTSDNRAEHG